MKKKSNYDGGLNYNKVFKPTCPHLKFRHKFSNETLSGRQVKDMKTKFKYDDRLNYNKFFQPTCLYIKCKHKIGKLTFWAGRLKI
jgi:hypothetical protein